jgi:hypothetical protein
MAEDTPSPLGNVISIDDERIKDHLDRVVRGTVEETLKRFWMRRQIGCAMHSATNAVKRAGIPAPPLRAQAADQGWCGAAKGSEASPADL